MIISRTPFRISFAGGGTDLPAYYREHDGCVTSTAINKYMYITVHEPFDHRIRLKYAKTELVDDLELIDHPLIKASLEMLDIREGIEITSMADIPAKAGLGSSSSFTVGLLHALHAFKGEHVSPEQLASEACDIEINRLGEPIGKQDQYIAAYGGLQHIKFNADDSVYVDPVICPKERKKALEEHLLLFHYGGSRSAGAILKEQQTNIPEKQKELSLLTDYARDVRDILHEGRDLVDIGRILHESWCAKRSLSSSISNPEIDATYEKAIKAGAIGGKLLGAGGGGFFLFFVHLDMKEHLKAALTDMRNIPFSLEPQGSKIIYVE